MAYDAKKDILISTLATIDADLDGHPIAPSILLEVRSYADGPHKIALMRAGAKYSSPLKRVTSAELQALGETIRGMGVALRDVDARTPEEEDEGDAA